MKTLIENYMNDVWNKKALESVSKTFHSNATIHSALGSTTHGPHSMSHSMLEIVQKWLLVFPDLKVTLLHTIAENDLVVSQWEAHGTHQGEFKGIAPSHRSVKYSGVSIYRVTADKVIEYWSYIDMQSILLQIHNVNYQTIQEK
jgi:predicted ester cyclase